MGSEPARIFSHPLSRWGLSAYELLFNRDWTYFAGTRSICNDIHQAPLRRAIASRAFILAWVRVVGAGAGDSSSLAMTWAVRPPPVQARALSPRPARAPVARHRANPQA